MCNINVSFLYQLSSNQAPPGCEEGTAQLSRAQQCQILKSVSITLTLIFCTLIYKILLKLHTTGRGNEKAK